MVRPRVRRLLRRMAQGWAVIAAVVLWLLGMFYPVAHYADGPPSLVPHAQSMTLEAMREQNFRAELVRSRWPVYTWPDVVRIARCESRFESDAVSEDGKDFGDLQIRREQHPELVGFDLLDRPQNIEAGWVVYQKQGWEAWACA